MKEDILRRREIYTGTICELERTYINGQSLVKILYVGEGECIKVNDNLFYDPFNHEFLPFLDILQDKSECPCGKYLLSPQYEDKLDSPFIFTKDEEGNYKFSLYKIPEKNKKTRKRN